MRALLLLLLLTPLAPALRAQAGSTTEKSIQLEQRFIEAKREALLGNVETALEQFETLADEQPGDDAIQFELGRLLYAADKKADAIDALKRAYAARPTDVYADFLAKLYQETGRYRDGADLYAALRKRNPADESAYLEQAAFLVRAGEIKDAIRVYDDLEDRIGINAELARHKHALYLGQGDQKRAERELTQLVEALPRQIEYRHLLAGYYQSQNQPNDARRVYDAILGLEPNDVRAQLALQQLGAGAGAGSENEEAGDELIRMMARPDVDIDLKIGRLLPLVQRVASSGDPDLGRQALVAAGELRRVHPDQAKAAAIEGDLLFHTGQYAKAAEAYRATLELDDTVFPVWEQLLTTYYLTNDIVALRETAENALDIFPNRPSVYVHYAIGEAMRGDFDEAESLLQQAQLMVSTQPEATKQLAELQSAFQALELNNGPAPKLDYNFIPGGGQGPLGRLLALRAGGRAKPASQLAALRALDTEENSNPLLLELLGDALLDSGDREAAANAFKRAKAAESASPTLRRKLASVAG